MIEINRFFRLVGERLKPSFQSTSSLSSLESSASSLGFSLPAGAQFPPGGPGSAPLTSGSFAATPSTGMAQSVQTPPTGIAPTTGSSSPDKTVVGDKPTELAEAALIVVRYIVCSELFATAVQEKTIYNLDPKTTAMKDLYGLILHQEKVDEGFTLELFSHEGYPLSANEFTSHCKCSLTCLQ